MLSIASFYKNVSRNAMYFLTQKGIGKVKKNYGDLRFFKLNQSAV